MRRAVNVSFIILLMACASSGFQGQGRLQKYHSPRTLDQGFAVIAYYPIWGVCDMPPQDIDWKAFSHLIFFWGEPTTTYPYFNLAADACDSTIFENGGVCNGTGWCLNPLDNGSNGLTHQAILRDSAMANGVKLLLCVGGETGTPAATFAGIIADTSMQDAFIQAATGFATRHGYDGIDIDWEFPTRGSAGRASYTRFLTKMRAALDTWSPRGVLSMAVPTWFWWDPGKTDPIIDVSTLNATVDFIDLMEYGMQNSSAISHYSPLYRNPSVSQETWDTRGIREWKNAGVDSSRIVTLIPFESITMADISGSLPVQVGHASSGSQWIGLRDVPPGVTMHWDDVAKANWGESGNTFYSFESQTSINAKVQYARDQHIRGIGIWELWRGWLPNAAPGNQQPLLENVKSAVTGGVSPGTQPKIRGQIFFDKNNNGILDVGERGMSGWTVRLSGPMAASAITDSGGRYAFYDLPPGDFLVSLDARSLWSQTVPLAPPSYSFENSGDSTVFTGNFGCYTRTVVTLEVSSGWNMVSLPVEFPNATPVDVFPSASSLAFGFDSSYVVAAQLSSGVGYWIKFPQPQVLYIAGVPSPADTIPLLAGWNLIGASGFPVSWSSLSGSSSPPGILSSNAWGYEGRYITVDSLRPGQGYWVEAREPGSIIFGSNVSSPPGSASRIVGTSQLNSLAFSDRNGSDDTLFFTTDPIFRALEQSSKLPPPPPLDGFDARYGPHAGTSFGSAVAVLDSSTEVPVHVQSASHAIIVSWKINEAKVRYLLKSELAKKYSLSGSGSLVLQSQDIDTSETTHTFYLQRAGPEDGTLPATIVLRQNYPNPFNNSTQISFSLPTDGEVRLDLYDILGQRVAILVNRIMNAGDHLLSFDGSILSSGIYIYRVTLFAHGKTWLSNVQTMSLLK